MDADVPYTLPAATVGNRHRVVAKIFAAAKNPQPV
jgi:hypothetical protein